MRDDYPINYMDVLRRAQERLYWESQQDISFRDQAQYIADPKKLIEDQLLRDYWANDTRG